MKLIKSLIKSLVDAIGAIGSFLMVVAWSVTFVCITFGLAIWSWQWFDGLLTNLLNGF